MLPEKQDSTINKTEFRDIGGAEGLLAAYQKGERNFTEVDLENADLSTANLVEINLKGANLKRANLVRVDLQCADLSEANLSNANLEEAKLDAANLKDAILIEANLNYAYMARAELIEANLQQAKLENADLTAANLQKCVLDKANCSGVRLRKAQLQQASLIQAYLRKGKLQLANLRDSNLQKADLSETQLEGAILTNTDLRGANIAQAREANLQLAILGNLGKKIEESLHLSVKIWRSDGSSFAFSPDSKVLAYTASGDENIILINTNTGKQINKINIQSEPVVSVVFGGNGINIYESVYVNELKVWNPLTGNLIQNLKNHPANITSSVFDGNGEIFDVIGTGKPFELFDLGHETRTLKGYSNEILTKAHSPDGQFIARSGPDTDGQIELLDRETGQRICILTGHKDPVQSLAFSPNSQILASKSIKDFKLWQVGTNEEIFSKYFQSRRRKFYPTVAFTLAKNQSHPVLVSSDFWDELYHRDTLTGNNDGNKWKIIIRDSTDTAVHALSTDGKILARRYGNQPVQLWNLQTGKELGAISLAQEYYRLALSSAGNILAVWDYEKDIELWDVRTKKLINSFTFHAYEHGQIAFSADDKMLAIGIKDYKIKLWNLHTNSEITTFQEYSFIYALAFSPSEQILASGNSDGVIRLWDLETMKEIHYFNQGRPQNYSLNLKFSPNGKFLASNDGSEIKLWKLKHSS